MNKIFEQKETMGTKVDSGRPGRSPANGGIQMSSRGKLASGLTGCVAAPEDGRYPATDAEARALKLLEERLWHFTSVGLGNCRAAQRVRREIECRTALQNAGTIKLEPGKKPCGMESLSAVPPHPDLLPRGEGNPLESSRTIRGSMTQSSTKASALNSSTHQLSNSPTLNQSAFLANANFNPDEPRDRQGRWTKESDAAGSATNKPNQQATRLALAAPVSGHGAKTTSDPNQYLRNVSDTFASRPNAGTNSPAQTIMTSKPSDSLPSQPTDAPKEETYAEPLSTLQGIAGLLDLAGKGVWNLASAGAFENIGDLEDALKQLGFSSDQLKKWGFKNVEEDSGTTGEKPIEQGIQSLPPPERALSRAGEGIVESTPRLGIAAANPYLGALAFGATTEGFDAKQAILTAALPLVGKYSGEITAAMAARAGVSSDIALQAFNKMGGAAGVTAVMGTDQLQQIMKLPPDQRKQALIDAAGMLGAMFILGMLGGGKPGEGTEPESKAAAPQEPIAYLEKSGTTGKWSYPNAPEAKAQIQNLRQWAQATGRVQNFQPPPDAEQLGGNEREGYRDPKTNRVYKRTDPPGTFGFLGVGPNLERTATPYSYLQRIALMNQAFGSDICVEGITPGDKPSIITSEPYCKPDNPESPHPSPDEVGQFMRRKGFEPLPNVPDGWFRKSDGIKVYDARPENFIKTKEKIAPVDLVLQGGRPTP